MPNSSRTASWGTVGTGKTTDAVHHLLMYHCNHPKNPIYSNINIKGVKTNPIEDAADFFEIIGPCFVLGDELWEKIDSQDHTKAAQSLNNVSLRSRKKHWTLHYTLQMITQMQKRTRYVTEVWRRPFYNEDTGIMDVEIYTVEGVKVGELSYDAWYVQKFFDTDEDPFTVETLESLKEKYIH